MQAVECGKCKAMKRSIEARCPNCERGVFKQRFYWMPIAAMVGLLLFSYSRMELPKDRDEQYDRQSIDACRKQAAAGPHTSQDPSSPCVPLIEDFILKYGHHPD